MPLRYQITGGLAEISARSNIWQGTQAAEKGREEEKSEFE